MTSGRHRKAGWASAPLRGNGHFNPHSLHRPCKETQGQPPVSEKASSVELTDPVSTRGRSKEHRRVPGSLASSESESSQGRGVEFNQGLERLVWSLNSRPCRRAKGHQQPGDRLGGSDHTSS